MSFAQKIRERRKALGLTQNQLAEMMHVSRQTISHWETARVTPDVESLRLLAETLDFRVTIGEEGAEVTAAPAEAPAAEEAAGAPQGPENKASKRKAWLWITLAAAVILFAAAAAAVLASGSTKKAEIIVTPQDGEARLIFNDKFGNSGGWDVPFYFENVSDVPFRVERIEGHYYEEDRLWTVAVVPAEELWPRMSSEWMHKGDFPLCWPFGSNQLHITHMVCIIYGTDANGNSLSFSGRVRYIPEPAE